VYVVIAEDLAGKAHSSESSLSQPFFFRNGHPHWLAVDELHTTRRAPRVASACMQNVDVRVLLDREHQTLVVSDVKRSISFNSELGHTHLYIQFSLRSSFLVRKMYNAHMKRYTVAEARARFSDLLDAAEKGQPAVIERRGVRFVIRPEEGPRRISRRNMIDYLDPAVAEGQWTWAFGPAGLVFKGRPRRK
jgi:antitoxin (DNA-binding transcriptional repressor) of toxin-antitoxin stability system